MKIQITQREINNMILARYALPPNTIVEIVAESDSIAKQAIAIIEAMGFSHDNFVDRIKHFREFTGVGLADAKFIIENWAHYKDYVNEHNEIPKGRLWRL